jgi:DNA-binding FadR family transcriptional regulator
MPDILDHRPPRSEQPKRAESIATELEGKILAGTWQLGERIGNEAELAERYRVSRWTMREAIAILEQAGTLTARRGVGGGLFTAASPPTIIRNSLCAYLELSFTPFAAIAEARLALTRATSELALQRMGNAERIALADLILSAEEGGQEAMEAMARSRALLRDIGANTLLALLLAALTDVGLHACWMSALDDETFLALIDRLTAATRRHTLAMVAGRLDLAMAAEAEGIAITGQLYAASSMSGLLPSAPNAFDRAYAIFPSAHSTKKAERVAWAIRQHISDHQLAPGAVVGSEESLMGEYGVGRPVLREAIRILERLGAVRMRRGGQSGLTVSRPSPDHVVTFARNYLQRHPPADGERAVALDVLRGIDAANPVAAMFRSIVACDQSGQADCGDD